MYFKITIKACFPWCLDSSLARRKSGSISIVRSFKLIVMHFCHTRVMMRGFLANGLCRVCMIPLYKASNYFSCLQLRIRENGYVAQFWLCIPFTSLLRPDTIGTRRTGRWVDEQPYCFKLIKFVYVHVARYASHYFSIVALHMLLGRSKMEGDCILHFLTADFSYFQTSKQLTWANFNMTDWH